MGYPDTGIFTGGQMTDLPSYPGTAFDGTELIEIVAPGNVRDGVNYSITSAQLGTLISDAEQDYINTLVVSGSSYNSTNTDQRILINKPAGSPTAVVLLPAQSYVVPVLVKDLKGDADTNPITITFSLQTADGLSSVVISTPFGGFWFNPLTAGNFYITTG